MKTNDKFTTTRLFILVLLTVILTSSFANASENLLPNSSFEVGLTDWEIRSGTIETLQSKDAPHGKYVVDIKQSASISAPWINLEPNGVTYEFSVYARSKNSKGKLTLSLFNALNRNLQRRNRISEWSTRKTFALTENWTRYSLVIDKLGFSWRDAYRPLITASSNTKVQLDAVSLTVKSPDNTYKHPETILMGMGTQYPSNIFGETETIRPYAMLYTSNPEKQPNSLLINVKDADGTSVYNNKFKLYWQDKTHSRKETKLKLPVGFYELSLKAIDKNKNACIKRSFNLAVVTSHLNEPADPQSPFGTMVSATSDMFDAKLAGVGFLRFVSFPNWDLVERTQGKLQWPPIEKRIDFAKRLSLVIQAGPMFVPQWARSTDQRGFSFRPSATPPADPNLFADFCTKAVKKYGNTVKLWEIWNEPNAKSYFNGSVEEYVRLAILAYKAIKAVDPQAQVWTCSTWNIDPNWLGKACKNNILNYSDAIAPHGYRKTAPETWQQDIEKLKQTMTQNGGKIIPIVCTEFGYNGIDEGDDHKTPYLPELKPVDGKIPTQRQQAAFMVRTYVITMANGLSHLVWYKWSEKRGNNIGPDTHGLNKILPIPQPKAGLLAYNTMATCLHKVKNGKRIETGDPEIYIYQFDTSNGPVTTAWTTGCSPKQYELEIKNTDNVQIREMLGKTYEANITNNKLKLTLTAEPIFIQM